MAFQSAKQITKGLKFESGGELDVRNAAVIKRVQNKTASYTCLESDSGTTFFTLGATDITFTLPLNPRAGLHYWFINSTAGTLTVTGAANVVVAYADATATSCAVTDIGVMVFAIADGNSWHIVSYADALAAATLVVT